MVGEAAECRVGSERQRDVHGIEAEANLKSGILVLFAAQLVNRKIEVDATDWIGFNRERARHEPLIDHSYGDFVPLPWLWVTKPGRGAHGTDPSLWVDGDGYRCL